MKCPKCSHELVTVSVDRTLEVDLCSECLGLWFDRGELARYFGTERDLPIGPRSPGSSRRSPCPKCDGQLSEVSYNTVGPGIIIDLCEYCHGIWLDQGEAPQINKEVLRVEEPVQRVLRLLSTAIKDPL